MAERETAVVVAMEMCFSSHAVRQLPRLECGERVKRGACEVVESYGFWRGAVAAIETANQRPPS